MPVNSSTTLASVYLKWIFLRAIFHRGWWLVASLYFVTEANLNALQLVLLGTGQGLVVLLCEIPTGVVADTFSRKLSLLISHLLMGLAMLMTGLVTAFPWLLFTQMLWGLSWTFASGADIAWITDELDDNTRIDRLLGRAATLSQVGSALGLVLFGAIAWLTSLSTAIVGAGVLMLSLGGYVLWRFSERQFQPNHHSPITELRRTLRLGLVSARTNRIVLLLLSVTFLINGADEAFTRLFAKGLIDLGLPAVPPPIVWLTGLGLVTLGVGAICLALIERWLEGASNLRRLYLAGCLIGTVGLAMFALATDYRVALLGVVLVHGAAWNVVRIVSVIWTNQQAKSETRATLQSFLSQAENLGEVMIGFALAHAAYRISLPAGLLSAALVTAIAGVLIVAIRLDRTTDGPGIR